MKQFLIALAVCCLAACVQAPRAIDVPAGAELGTSAWTDAATGDAAWHHYPFPGKTPTQYGYVRLDGRDAMAATSVSSASMLRRKLFVKPEDFSELGFSWKVPALVPDADMTQRDKDDSPVRVVLAFDGDRSTFSMKNSMLSELARALTGEPMPYATLMYVWANDAPPGTVIINPRTDRIRKIVLESGPGGLNRWHDYRRDIRADFEKAFGEAPGALVGLGIMTDSDNTQSHARAWYGPVRLMNTTAFAR